MANPNEQIEGNNTAREHVDVLICEMERMINNRDDFNAFILLSIGIEFIGSFTDSFEFDDFGKSKSRFENALDHWFSNKWYKNNKKWMFENLRGPLLHQYRPGNEIFLTSNVKKNVDLNMHLKEDSGKIIFVVEQLLEDFKDACEKMDFEFEKETNPYQGSKMQEKYQTMYEIQNWNGENQALSGHGMTIIVKTEEE